MSNSNPLVALAHSFATRGQGVDERVDVLILRGPFANPEEQQAAVSQRTDVELPFLSVQLYDPEIGGDLEDDEPFDPARTVLVTIRKSVVDGDAVFVFATAAIQHIQSGAPARLVACLELDARAGFLCRGLKVEPWVLEAPLEVPAETVPINPRKLVKDFVPEREIADDLSPWLRIQAPALKSSLYEAWSAQAARRLLGSLVNAALQEDGEIWLQANGPPMLRVPAAAMHLRDGLDELLAGTEWVYLAGEDRDARHLIFAVELARATRPDMPFREGIRQAREAAITTYAAHVQSASRETLKALADLRKTVIDETQKVTQRAQDLTSGLWRDVAVSAAPFVIKILGDTAKQPNGAVSAGFYFAAAAFVAVSFGLQWRINGVYLTNQREARSKWFETLYAVISSGERKTIAEDPITKAEAGYRETRNVIAVIYSVLVVILVSFGAATLSGAAVKAPPSPAAEAPPAADAKTERTTVGNTANPGSKSERSAAQVVAPERPGAAQAAPPPKDSTAVGAGPC